MYYTSTVPQSMCSTEPIGNACGKPTGGYKKRMDGITDRLPGWPEERIAAESEQVVTHHSGFQALASFWASATCAGVILAAIWSRLLTANSRDSDCEGGRFAAARFNHLYAST